MSNKLYDILKWIAQILLPAIATLYFALAGIWNLPYGEEIVGTITAIDTFLGVILGISSKSYYTNQITTQEQYQNQESEQADTSIPLVEEFDEGFDDSESETEIETKSEAEN